jgi:hypothetical protein
MSRRYLAVGLLVVLPAVLLHALSLGTGSFGRVGAQEVRPPNAGDLVPERVAWLGVGKPFAPPSKDINDPLPPDPPVVGTSTFAPVGDEIRGLTVGPTGALWVATDRGLSKLANGTFHHYTRKQGLPDDQVYAVAATECGVVAGTQNGLVWLADPEPASSAAPPQFALGDFVTSVAIRMGKIWFLARNRQAHQARDVAPSAGSAAIKSLALDHKGHPGAAPPETEFLADRIRSLLPGQRGKFFFESSPGKWQEFDPPLLTAEGS